MRRWFGIGRIRSMSALPAVGAATSPILLLGDNLCGRHMGRGSEGARVRCGVGHQRGWCHRCRPTPPCHSAARAGASVEPPDLRREMPGNTSRFALPLRSTIAGSQTPSNSVPSPSGSAKFALNERQATLRLRSRTEYADESRAACKALDNCVGIAGKR